MHILCLGADIIHISDLSLDGLRLVVLDRDDGSETFVGYLVTTV
jgi:hypothetical protein